MPRARTLRRAAILVAALAVLAVGATNLVVLHEGARTEAIGGSLPGEADTIVVLGAGVHPDGTPSDMLTDRLETGLQAYRDGLAPRILVSGDHGRASYDESGTMQAWLVHRGVPAEAVLVDHAGFDTYSSMWRAKNLFSVRRAIIVTQSFHLPRAVYLAERMGMSATPRAADRRRYRGIVWSQVREIASRTKAWLDVGVGRRPRYTTLAPAT
jgi:vancomycin permeability regulator SanA